MSGGLVGGFESLIAHQQNPQASAIAPGPFVQAGSSGSDTPQGIRGIEQAHVNHDVIRGEIKMKLQTMTSLRKTALVAGAFYLLTFVSIPTLAMYAAVRSPNYILGAGPDTPVIVGAILEIIVALAGIGTAVALYPVVKRQGEARAVGFVASRTLEAAAIFAGVTTLLSVVALRQAGVGAGALFTSQALVAQYSAMFLISQSFIPAVNAVLLGSLLYQSRLVPRALPVLGFVGATALTAAWFAIMFGFIGATSAPAALAGLTIALWEFSLGAYLVVKGFKASPLTAEMVDAPLVEVEPATNVAVKDGAKAA
jgi:hypothetical protein